MQCKYKLINTGTFSSSWGYTVGESYDLKFGTFFQLYYSQGWINVFYHQPSSGVWEHAFISLVCSEINNSGAI